MNTSVWTYCPVYPGYSAPKYICIDETCRVRMNRLKQYLHRAICTNVLSAVYFNLNEYGGPSPWAVIWKHGTADNRVFTSELWRQVARAAGRVMWINDYMKVNDSTYSTTIGKLFLLHNIRYTPRAGNEDGLVTVSRRVSGFHTSNIFHAMPWDGRNTK